MNRYVIASIVMISIVTGFAGGVYLGYKKATEDVWNLSWIVNAAIGQTALKIDELNQQQNCNKIAFELEIDAAFLAYEKLSNTWSMPLAKHFSNKQVSSLERAISALVEYRKTHPVVYTPDLVQASHTGNKKLDDWTMKNHEESIRDFAVIQNFLRSRGVPEEMLSTKPNSPDSAK